MTTRLELTETASGGTRVSVALRCEPTGRVLAAALQSRAPQRLVRRTLEGEPAWLPDHGALGR